MSKVKLMIEIDEAIYNEFMKENDYELIYNGYWVAKAIAKGTPITEGDLISREGMRKMIKGWLNMDKYYHPYSKGKTIPTDEVYDLIDNAPSIGGNQNE